MKKQFYFLFLLILTSFVLGCSKSDDSASSPDAELTDEQIEQVEQMFDAVTSIEDECNRLVELVLTDGELKELITEYINSLDHVVSTESDDDYYIKITYDSGLESYVMVGNPRESSDDVDYVSNYIANSSSLTYNTNSIQTKSTDDSDNIITNNKVLIWAPFEDQFTSIMRTTLTPIFEKKYTDLEFGSFAVDTIVGSKCDINSILKIPNYGIVIFDTHGLGGFAFFTREATDDNSYNKEKMEMILKEKIVVVSMPLSDGKSYYALTSNFINDIFDKGDFQNSLIFNGSCESTKTDKLWDAFQAKGVKTYLGFSKVVSVGFCLRKSEEFFTNMIVNLQTAEESYIKETDTNGDKPTFEFRGEQSLHFEKIEEEPESNIEIIVNKVTNITYNSATLNFQVVNIDPSSYNSLMYAVFEKDNNDNAYFGTINMEVGNYFYDITPDIFTLNPNTTYAVSVFANNSQVGNMEEFTTLEKDDSIETEWYLSEFTSSNYPDSDTWTILDKEANDDTDFDGLNYALKNCNRNVTLEFPNLELLPNSAFKYCSELYAINLPEVTHIGDDAFTSCGSLIDIDCPNVKTIGTMSFYGCEKLTNIDIPQVTSISGYAFMTCKALESINMASADYIGEYAFRSCESLTYIDLTLVTYIGESAFSSCYSLMEINAPKLTSVEESVFDGCTSIESVELPLATNISNKAFRYCDNLSFIHIPISTAIGDYSFRSCKSLSEIDMPSVTTIGEFAFYGCEKLLTVSLATNDGVKIESIYSKSSFYYTFDITLTVGSSNAEYVTVKSIGALDNQYVLEVGSYYDIFKKIIVL